jgi:hypothetical protein
MKIIQRFITNNDCYSCNEKITPRGLMLHSVGCAQPRAEVFVRNYNRSNYDVAVHAFIDGNDGTVYQTLPWTMRGWHGGGSSNDTHLGIEMCEPSTIRYTSGANWVETGDGSETRKVVETTYNSAVELFAYLCKQFNLNPLKDGVIVSHREGYTRGIASGHADPEHIWNKIGGGYTMDKFRRDVDAKMKGQSTATPSSPSILYKVQVGAFSKIENANALKETLTHQGFDTMVVNVNNLYKVQVGAYSQKANASAMLVKLKLAGFSNAFITEVEVKTVPVDNGGTLGLSIPVEIIEDPNVKEYTFSGVYNETVRKAQSYLNQNGARLTADGIFGPKTYQKLSDSYKVDIGYRSELVKCVQLRLNELGFNCGTADGIAGTNTMNAIAKFQKANNLGEGYLGGEDWYYLFK